MIIASAGTTFFSLIVTIYILGFIATVVLYRLEDFRQGRVDLLRLFIPHKRDRRKIFRNALAWPSTLPKLITGLRSGQHPTPPNTIDTQRTPTTLTDTPAGDGGFEMPQWGPIDEADS